MLKQRSTKYSYSRPLTEVSFAEALSDINFNEEKFDNRYDTHLTKHIVTEMRKFFFEEEYQLRPDRFDIGYPGED